jgi:uncharacterized RDD family membrane protein YckC
MVGKRILALVIDWVSAILVAQLVSGDQGYGTSRNSLITLIIFGLQIWVFTWFIGSSFGQKIVGLRIETLIHTKPSVWQSLIRTLLILLVFPAFLTDQDGRGFHDRIAKTRIVKN